MLGFLGVNLMKVSEKTKLPVKAQSNDIAKQLASDQRDFKCIFLQKLSEPQIFSSKGRPAATENSLI